MLSRILNRTPKSGDKESVLAQICVEFDKKSLMRQYCQNQTCHLNGGNRTLYNSGRVGTGLIKPRNYVKLRGRVFGSDKSDIHFMFQDPETKEFEIPYLFTITPEGGFIGDPRIGLRNLPETDKLYQLLNRE